MATWLSVAELRHVLTDRPTMLVEALSADFHAAGHLPGAVSLPLSATDDEIMACIAGRSGATIVVYGSRSGGEAVELADRLPALGHDHVLVLEGGKEAWVEAGHPLERLDD